MRVAVIGAGVIGMTSAVAVKNAFPHFEVDVFADKFSPETTGDGSAGLWGPYLIGDTPPDKILKWGARTHGWFEEFWKTGLASEIGLSLVPVYRVTSDPKGFPDSSWTKAVYGAHRFTAKELEKLNAECEANYKDGWIFVTYACEPVLLLPWLAKRFQERGGKLVRRKIENVCELVDGGYELVINCSGLGARELIGDITVLPIRGQVARVSASWVSHGFLEDDDHGNYIIPNFDNVVVGGTHQENNFNTVPSEEDSEYIRVGCCRLLPSLKGAKLLKEWVGLRPGKSKVRLETELFHCPSNREVVVIHNYGHGGAGVTLSWGCALDVVEAIKATRRQKSNL